MPRKPVPKENRRRVARACDSCKRRKERCNGLEPCSICIRRGKQNDCRFTDTPARLLRQGGVESGENATTPVNQSTQGRRESGIAIGRLLNDVDQKHISKHPLTKKDQPSSAEPSGEVPHVARLLRDGQGKYMYIGDSASLSFLQTVRRVVTLAVGECDLTADPKRHTILETTPSLPMMLSSEFLPLKYDDVAYLARQYLLATAGLTDMLEMDTFWNELEAWANDPARDLNQRSCIFYLVIAIGAQVTFDASRQIEAEQYYARGRQLAFYNFTEAPSLMTVQAYTLISVYMLGACRRNGAFMNFGIACQATFALGLHVRYSKGTFDERETRARRYTWRSVRLLDSFFAASLGRPPATSDPEMMSNSDQPDTDGSGDFTDKVLSLATIYDRIVLEVYIRKAVSTRLAESISQQLRTWTEGLPASLDLQALPYDESRLAEVLAATHIISSYHWAIILLTRPFLTSQILQDMARKKAAKSAQSSNTPIKADDPAIKMFADACVDSALKGLAAVVNLIKYRTLPRRLPILINAVCNIALVLGAAVFADQDKNFPLLSGLEQALQVLRHFTPHDPHASRYEQIISYLSNAVKKYIHGRDRQSMELRSKELSQLFGSVSNPSPETENGQAKLGASSSATDLRASTDSSSTPRILLEPYDPVTPVSFAKTPNDSSEMFTFGQQAPFLYSDAMQPPSTIFDDSQFAFPNDAYLFMEQDPSIFSFWTGS